MTSVRALAVRWRRRGLAREWKRLAGASVLALLASGLAVAASWLMAPLGETLFPAGSESSSGVVGLAERTIRGIFGGMTPASLVVAMALVYLTKNAAEFASRAFTDRSAAAVERRARSSVWSSLWAPGTHAGRMAQREEVPHALLIDGKEAAAWAALGPVRIVGDPAALLGYLATMVWIAPALAAALAVIVPPGLWLARRGLRAIARGSDRFARARAELGARMGEILALAPVVHAFRLGNWARDSTRDRETAAEQSGVAWALRRRAAPAIAETIAACAGALLIWLGLRTIGAGALSGAEFLTFLTALFLMMPVVKRLGALSGDLRTADAAWERLAARRGVDLVRSPRVSQPPEKTPPEIAFNGVAFAAAGGALLLGQLDILIPARAMTVVVGPTGAGKSLLLELASGVEQPSSGAISWSGADTAGPVGYVPQEGWAFAGTVEENVRMGRPLGTEEVDDALRSAALELPRCARLGEFGAPLSGGERQRLALARALAGRPKLLVLDEPTSAVDSATEAEIVRDLRHRADSATVLVSSHSSALRAAADMVVHLEAGRVADVTGRAAPRRRQRRAQ